MAEKNFIPLHILSTAPDTFNYFYLWERGSSTKWKIVWNIFRKLQICRYIQPVRVFSPFLSSCDSGEILFMKQKHMTR